jgi:predicted ATP-grasp superfamily ATP-dependent carboligase
MSIRILVHEWVTGGGLAGLPLPGSWATEGRALRQAVAAEFLAAGDVEVVVTLDPRLAGETGPWESVVVAAGREEFTLERLARACDFTLLIAPETAGTLASLTELVEDAGGRTLGPTREAIALTADKHRLAAFLLRKGIPTPPVEWYDRACPATPAFGYPAVVKPVDGAGSLDTFLVRRPEERFVPTAWAGDLVIQPYYEGTAMSASFLVAAGGQAELLGVGWQHVEVEDGRFVYRGGRLPGPRAIGLEVPRKAVEAIPGLRGFVGVDFIRQAGDGRPVVIEINPRPTTSFIGLRWLFTPGTLARAWLNAVEGRSPLDALRAIEPPPGEGTVRFLADGTIEPDGGQDHDDGHP